MLHKLTIAKKTHDKYKLFTANIKNSQKNEYQNMWDMGSFFMYGDVLEIMPSFILLVLFSSYPLKAYVYIMYLLCTYYTVCYVYI